MFFIFLPLIALLVYLFFYDGMTTARTNPDSSRFIWALVFSIYPIVIGIVYYFISLFILLIIKDNIKNSINSINKLNRY